MARPPGCRGYPVHPVGRLLDLSHAQTSHDCCRSVAKCMARLQQFLKELEKRRGPIDRRGIIQSKSGMASRPEIIIS